MSHEHTAVISEETRRPHEHLGKISSCSRYSSDRYLESIIFCEHTFDTELKTSSIICPRQYSLKIALIQRGQTANCFCSKYLNVASVHQILYQIEEHFSGAERMPETSN